MHANNAEGSERLTSLIVGTTAVSSGIKQGGAGGLFKIALAAMMAKRALTGHCQLKGMLNACEHQEPHNEQRASIPDRNQESITPKSAKQAQDSAS